MTQAAGTAPDKSEWDRHWRRLRTSRSLFGTVASLVRRLLFRRVVARFARRHFPRDGVVVEVGCGTGEASAGLDAPFRVGADFSLGVLAGTRHSGVYDAVVAADASALPFRDGTVAGVWNFGVMEHFPEPQGIAILRELRRVLAPGAAMILFWPPEYGSSRLVLAPIERLRTAWTGKPFAFFPDEVNRLRGARHGMQLLADADLEPVAASLTWRDAFIHRVVIGRRPAA